MTQIDEKALQAAILQGTVMIDRDDARKVVTAYLATSLPTGDVGLREAIDDCEEARKQRDVRDRFLVQRGLWGEFCKWLPDELPPVSAEARIAELEREASRAEIYRAVLESAGYQNIDTIKDVMNAKALGAVVACCFIGLQNNLASATSRAERLEAALVKLGPTDGWAAMIAELQGWTASEFLSGEGGNTKDQVECYSFMCRLIGWLMVAQDAAALSPAPATDVQLPKGWLADEFARVDADVAQWSPGMKDSFREATGIAIPPAPAPSEGGDGWQDIASAPRDGTLIQIWQDGLEPNQYVAAFDDRWSNGGWWVICDGKNTEIPLRGPAPTHWRNVFAAPTAPETT